MGHWKISEVEARAWKEDDRKSMEALVAAIPAEAEQLSDGFVESMQTHLMTKPGKIGTLMRCGNISAYGVGMTGNESFLSAKVALSLTHFYLTKRLKQQLSVHGLHESIADKVRERFTAGSGIGEVVIRVREGLVMPMESLPQPPYVRQGRSAFDVLDVTCSATFESINRAVRNLASNLHPDKPGGSKEEMQEVADARDWLSLPGGIQREWERTRPAGMGACVVIRGLVKHPHLNGQQGLAGEWDGCRVHVHLLNGGGIAKARAGNVVVIPGGFGGVAAGPNPESPHVAAAAGRPTETWHGKVPCPGKNGIPCPNEAWLKPYQWQDWIKRCKTCKA